MGLEKPRDTKTGQFSEKHGQRHSRLYRIWDGLRRRCNDPKAASYKSYGGRGIKVCPEWDNDFQSFYEWAMANGYEEDLTIDRINNDGNYEPNNCRWVTPKEQAKNKRNTPYVTYNGMIKTQREWDNYFGLRPGTINKRITIKGMSAEKAMQGLMPNQKARNITYKGKTMSIRQWSKVLGIKYCTLIGRLTTRGWSVEKAFTTPTDKRFSVWGGA
jgi:hypothetical protein